MVNDMIDDILVEREATHGSFESQANLARALKDAFWENISTHLEDDQSEAIDMILHKIARIGSGNPDFLDHWVDIIGYATLVKNRLEKNGRRKA